MTINTYADIIPQPAPVTTGTTIQSYTDPNGDLWVAKNGVNGGAWKRAANVLRASITLTANVAVATGWLDLSFGQIIWDAYGLMVLGVDPFLAPLPGYYDIRGGVAANTTTTRWMCSIYRNGAEFKRGSDASNGTLAVVSVVEQLNANDKIGLAAYTSAASTAIGGVGNTQTYLTVSYLNPLTG